MKKNISINISGIIFHVEEDGYEHLKKYLESINIYFSSFEDSQEIIDDIENRIAEIFLSKLSDGKQVITYEDVETLIATMGTISDFEAASELQEKGDYQEDEKDEKSNKEGSQENAPKFGTKRLYRDMNRRILGGVAAGIAHYFNIDPLWIRLIIILLFFNIIILKLSGIILISYIILWIIVPASESLEEDKKIKKLYRNPDDRVLSGVAGGLASYFGADPTIIRLIFVISIFLGGAGIIIYFILWIITPEAKSITEKMQMQGEPVTLANIESNVKRTLNLKEGEEESALVKILLFPFRLIATMINGLSKAIGPFADFMVQFIRVVVGVVLIITGISLIMAFSALLATALGFSGLLQYTTVFDWPLDLLAASIPWYVHTGVFVIGFIPSLFIIFLGLAALAKRWLVNAYAGWSLLAIWVLSFILVVFLVPNSVGSFKESGVHQTITYFPLDHEVTHLKINKTGYRDYKSVDLRLRSHQDSIIKLSTRIESRAFTRDKAEEAASLIDYHVVKQDASLIFDSNLGFEKIPFRFQEVSLTLYIPEKHSFRVGSGVEYLLEHGMVLQGINDYGNGNNQWMFTNGRLICIDCEERIDFPSSQYEYDGNNNLITYDFKDFDEVIASSALRLNIEHSDEFKVELSGEKKMVRDVVVEQRGDNLKLDINRDMKWWLFNDRDELPLVNISMPIVNYLELSGACKANVVGFDNESITMKLNGASRGRINADFEEVSIDLEGASVLLMVGKADILEANLSGASKLSAYEFRVENVSVNASGASKAEVYAKDYLTAGSSGFSKITYRGQPNINQKTDGLGDIKRDDY
ncbi:MAG TPA: PspC domain-containing protein [Cyclobacteriaceae bacterium]